MEISELARAILHSPDLADKLFVPDELTDLRPTAGARARQRPARVPGMRFAPAGRRPAFPTSRAIEQPHGRALALHFFANHELLALELMALALLRFVDAEPAFRMGIAHTMLEEQKHFRLYADRIEQLGVSFGDFGLNSFFWDALSNMRTPMDYVTQLSMTFEQANLDYAAHYGQLFHDLGDPETARIFETIHDDEVGHLAYGLRWFQAWRAPGEDLWEAWSSALPDPLSPAWGRGIAGVGFCEEGRRRAGLPEDFIRRVRSFSRSRGRPPRIYLFNPSLRDLAGVQPDTLDAVRRDLLPASAILARSEDVMLGEPLSLEQTEHLVARGVQPPEFLPLSEVHALKDRGRLHAVIPWRWDDDARALDELLRPELLRDAPDLSAKALLEATLPSTPEPLGEPLLSIAWVFAVGPRAAPPVPVRLLATGPGVHAHVVNQLWDGVGEKERRWLHEARSDGTSPFKGMGRAALRVRTHLRGAGYRGSATMPIRVDRTDDGPRWKISSVRLGPSLDLIAAELRRRVAPGRYGLWLQVDRERLAAAGFSDFGAMADVIDYELPLRVDSREADVRMLSGVLWTADPRSCSRRASLLLVEQSGAALRALSPAVNALLGG